MCVCLTELSLWKEGFLCKSGDGEKNAKKWLKFGCCLYLFTSEQCIYIRLHPCDTLIHTPTPPPHSEQPTDMSRSAHNDNNRRCLIYSRCGLNFTLQISPSMLPCCSAGFLRSPISHISITEPKRTDQGSFMPLINPQNKTCYDSFWTCSQHTQGIKWVVANKYCLILLWKKLYFLLILL